MLVFHMSPNEGRSSEEGAVGGAVQDRVLVLGPSVRLSKWVCLCECVCVHVCLPLLLL